GTERVRWLPIRRSASAAPPLPFSAIKNTPRSPKPRSSWREENLPANIFRQRICLLRHVCHTSHTVARDNHRRSMAEERSVCERETGNVRTVVPGRRAERSEEHTSELQSRFDLV